MSLMAEADVWDWLGMGGGFTAIGVVLKSVFDYFLKRKSQDHSAEMEKEERGRQAKIDENERLLAEWKEYVKKQDRRIAELEKDAAVSDGKMDKLREDQGRLLVLNAKLVVRLEVSETAMRQAGIPVPQFRNDSIEEFSPNSSLGGL